MNPHVTVLTAVRNGAQHVGETIESIQRQTFKDWEYIFVDDASTDNTLSVIAAYQRSDPRLRVIRREVAAGPYTAANDGLREALGKYVIRIDADDLATPNRIDRHLAYLRDHPEYRACVSYWQGWNEKGMIPGTVTTVPDNSRVFRWALLLRSASIHSAVCYERSMMEEIGGYRDLPLSQDYRLWCELTRRNWLGIMPEVLCYVRSHPKRESHARYDLQRNLALDVLEDHMRALTGERWSREDLTALRAVGHSEPMSTEKGTEMLDRWERMWQQDSELTSEDRKKLLRLSALRRWKHLRANARKQPIPVMFGLLKLATTKPQFLVPALKGIGS